jgi:myo-inositol-hexaphosphate 3-phosphohydrolase
MQSEDRVEVALPEGGVAPDNAARQAARAYRNARNAINSAIITTQESTESGAVMRDLDGNIGLQ